VGGHCARCIIGSLPALNSMNLCDARLALLLGHGARACFPSAVALGICVSSSGQSIRPVLGLARRKMHTFRQMHTFQLLQLLHAALCSFAAVRRRMHYFCGQQDASKMHTLPKVLQRSAGMCATFRVTF
jgi:hypothetical protein